MFASVYRSVRFGFGALVVALCFVAPGVARADAPAAASEVEALRRELAEQKAAVAALVREMEALRQQVGAAPGTRPAAPPPPDPAEPAPPAGTAAPAATPLPKPAADAFPLEVAWKDGLRFKSANGDFDAFVAGQVFLHYRSIFDHPTGAGTNPDGFFVRQARPTIGGTLLKQFEYKVQFDFPTGSSSATGTPMDTYLGWTPHPAFNLRLGQFKEPFSQEELSNDLFVDYVERSNLNRLAPGRDIGVMVWGKLCDGQFGYEAGVNNGRGRAVFDTDDEKDVAARVTAWPFKKTALAALAGLRLGLAGTYGRQDDVAFTDVTSTETGTRWLDADADLVNDGARTRFGAELSWGWRNLTLRAEYARQEQELKELSNGRREEIEADAWYVSATWLITGENKPVEGRILPAHAFAPGAGHWGALDVTARYHRLTYGLDLFEAGFANDSGTRASAQGISSVTVGVNWQLARSLRFMADFVHNEFDRDVQFEHRTADSENALLFRGQIDF
ncbi:MAG: hypothetical protein HZA54_12015 [Planctomycetes bacterium]|nr:hypothetical protein [Planctomycetota bacterium]